MKIDPYRLEAMKRLHLPTIMRESGVELKDVGRDSCMGRCPFHEDKNPSLSVGKRGDKWVWNCFGCRAKGNVIDFKMKKEEKSFGEVYEALLPAAGGRVEQLRKPVSPPTGTPVPSAASSVRPEVYLARAVEIYHAAFCESKAAQGYLSGRGITDGESIRRFKVGFVDGRLRRMLPADPGHEFAAGLKAAGVLNGQGKERFHGRIVFPIFDGNGAPVGLYGRGVGDAGAAVPHLYLPGPHRGVWNAEAFKAYREIVLVESIIDALSLHQLGFLNAVPVYGVNGFTEGHSALLRGNRTKRVLLCFDNDEAGERARRVIRAALEAAGVEAADVRLPNQYKDANEALKGGMTAAEFKEVLAAVGSKAAEGPAAPVPAASPSVEEKEDGIHVAFPFRRYRVSGLSSRTRDQLRVNLKVEDGEGTHLDQFALYSSAAREKFVSCCRKVMKAEGEELHRELNRLIAILESRQTAGKEEDGERPPMTAEEAAEALAFLRRPSLLADILKDMEAMGYVGEEANKTVGYLVGVSRKIEDPLSCVLMSQSSAGKSVLAETVEKLTPPEDVLLLSRLTQNSLFWMKRDALKHKLVILEERVGAEAADYSIRTLQSKKKLIQAVPVKNEKTGQIETQTFEVEGPIAYIETTTRPRIAEDNATRCFELSLDESPEQTRRIHEKQRRSKTLGGLKETLDRQAIQWRHWNMQRLLKPVRVVIPFAERLEFPTTWLRTRRDHLRFLNMIEVVCFLHQHQRPEEKTADGAEYILATVADYRAAYDLAGAVMGESLTELKKPQRRLLEIIRSMDSGEYGVTRRDIRERAGLADTRLRELLNDLVGLEFLRLIDGGGQGRVCRYSLTDLVEGDERRVAGLTKPEELADMLQVRGSR